MSIKETIIKLQTYNGPEELTLHKGANEGLLQAVENTYNIKLPEDFKEFYRFSDGFETVEDIFNMIPLAEIIENKHRNKNEPLYIAEYMIYSDMWQLEVNPDDYNDYKIIVEANYNKLVLTNSLTEFIEHFLTGGVFEAGGLYDWQKEVERQYVYTTQLKTTDLLLTFFHHGLRYNIISKEEVITWADSIVMHENEPENLIIEVSLCHDKNTLMSLLHSVLVPDSSIVARAILGVVYHRLLAGTINVNEAVSIIDNDLINQLTRSEEIQIYNFNDEIWASDLPVNKEELKKEVLNFLAGYKDFEIKNYKNWFGFNSHIQYQLSEKEKHLNTAFQIPKKESKIKLWMIYTFIYSLAAASVIVLINTYNMIEKEIPLSKYRSDIYQLSILYLTLFISYYILMCVEWLIKRCLLLFKKTVN